MTQHLGELIDPKKVNISYEFEFVMEATRNTNLAALPHNFDLYYVNLSITRCTIEGEKRKKKKMEMVGWLLLFIHICSALTLV